MATPPEASIAASSGDGSTTSISSMRAFNPRFSAMSTPNQPRVCGAFPTFGLQMLMAASRRPITEMGRRIVAGLARRKKSQSWLAEQCGVSDNAVSKWIYSGEIGRKHVTGAAGALGMSADELLGTKAGQRMQMGDFRMSTNTTRERILKLMNGMSPQQLELLLDRAIDISATPDTEAVQKKGSGEKG